MSSHLHDGHRQRMRERIMNGDLEKLQPHEVLEYLLFSFIPRKDTNGIAHALIKEFGSFYGVLNADPVRLSKVSGMTQNAALFLSNLPAVFRVYMLNKSKSKVQLHGRGEIREYMRDMYWALTEERVCAMILDPHDCVVATKEFDKGTGDSVNLNVRALVDFALGNKHCKLVLAHNHPSGVVTPSANDVAVTKELHYTLNTLDIELLDHYIFCDEKYFSFEEDGLMKDIKNNTKTLKEGVWNNG